MIKDLDAVVAVIRINDIKRWVIKRDSTNNSYVFKSSVGEGTIEHEIARMQKVLAYVESGRLIFQGWTSDNEKSANGAFSDEFPHLQSGNNLAGIGSASSPTQMTMVGYVSKEDMTVQIQAVEERMRREFELQILKEENAELKKQVAENGKPMAEFMKMVTPVAGVAIQGLVSKYTGGAQIGTVGVNDFLEKKDTIMEHENKNNVEEVTVEEAERFETSFNRWIEADSEALDLLEIISRMAEKRNEPGSMYNMAKTMLLNQK